MMKSIGKEAADQKVLRKTTKTLRIVSVPAKIRTRHLPKYRYGTLPLYQLVWLRCKGYDLLILYYFR
jgi:hypothetical protein